MRRPVIAGLVIGAMLVVPLAGHAASPPTVTITAPVSEDSTNGDLLVRWSYRAFHPSTPVYVDVLQGSTLLEHIWVDDIDDGTKGSFGSYTLSTTALAEAGDYVIRVVVATNRNVFSIVSDIGVDRTGPATTINMHTITAQVPFVAVLGFSGAATDAIAGVGSVAVTFTDSSGVTTTRDAPCNCGPRSTSVSWLASGQGLMPGEYTVSVVATDVVGNVGPASEATFLMLSSPLVPESLLETAAGTTEDVLTTTENLDETVATTTEPVIATATTTATTVVGTLTTTATSVVDTATMAAGAGA